MQHEQKRNRGMSIRGEKGRGRGKLDVKNPESTLNEGMFQRKKGEIEV